MKLLIMELPVVMYAIESISNTSFLVFALMKYCNGFSPPFFFKMQSPIIVRKYFASDLVSKMVCKNPNTF
jgi:hypothetical protein